MGMKQVAEEARASMVKVPKRELGNQRDLEDSENQLIWMEQCREEKE